MKMGYNKRIKLIKLEQTCYACPSQWEGITHDGKRFYARYRWGTLTAEINGVSIARIPFGDPLDGWLEETDMLSLLRAELI